MTVSGKGRNPDGSPNAILVTYTTSITVQPQPNRTPVANPDTATTAFNTPVAVDVTANDTDPDNDALTVSAIGTVTGGTTTLGADKKTITFAPTPGFSGTATGAYTVSDGKGATAQSTIMITVQPQPNTAPSAIALTSSAILKQGSLTLNQVVGTLSCTDSAPT